MNIVQITIMDEKGYILEYKDFKPADSDGIKTYILKQLVNMLAIKIHIRKW